MAKENQIGKTRNIFLSASVPKAGREFFGTEDLKKLAQDFEA